MITYKALAQPMDIIVVYNKKSWLHKIIKGVTGYKAGHVAQYMGDGQISEANKTGIHRRDWKNYNNNCYVYLCRYMQLTKDHEQKMKQYIYSVEGQKYSKLQLIAMFFNKTFRIKSIPDVSKQAQICSEFVTNAYLAAGIKISQEKPHNTAPSDICQSHVLCVIKGWE